MRLSQYEPEPGPEPKPRSLGSKFIVLSTIWQMSYLQTIGIEIPES